MWIGRIAYWSESSDMFSSARLAVVLKPNYSATCFFPWHIIFGHYRTAKINPLKLSLPSSPPPSFQHKRFNDFFRSYVEKIFFWLTNFVFVKQIIFFRFLNLDFLLKNCLSFLMQRTAVLRSEQFFPPDQILSNLFPVPVQWVRKRPCIGFREVWKSRRSLSDWDRECRWRDRKSNQIWKKEK